MKDHLPELHSIFQKIDAGGGLERPDLKALLALTDREEIEALYRKAYETKTRMVGSTVYFRGIVEFSNICEKDCYYCGIRKSNTRASRFLMDEEEIVQAALWCYEQQYGSIVLQSGERSNAGFIEMIERILWRIREQCRGELGTTLSLGEQSRETYQRWFEAGAHRYLLRIETSQPELYRKLHPQDHEFEARAACLDLLREIGYQVGTGVMIGLPFQTLDDLVEDICFFRDRDIDMIGMGPYIVHQDTPLAKEMPNFEATRDLQLELGLKMIAATRLHLQDVNIAATTALQALHDQGRELGLQAGANIVMPNVTDTKYRAAYQLYENKPCLDENSSLCRSCLSRRILNIGETIGFGKWGDSPHFFARISG